MPLKLEFKSGEKLMINGAVIENVGTNAKLLVHNEAAILRNKEVLSKADESTPAARVYLALQCVYMFPDQSDKYMKMFGEYLNDYVQACPSAKPIAEKIHENVAQGNIYKALKKTHDLIAHEANILNQFHENISHYIQNDEANTNGFAEPQSDEDGDETL